MNNHFEWIYGCWYVPSADDSQDFMALLGKEAGQWTIRLRFRYYNSSDPWDEKDVRKEGLIREKDNSDESFAKLLATLKTKIIPEIENQYGMQHDFVLLECKGDDPVLLEKLGSRPWVHQKKPTADE